MVGDSANEYGRGKLGPSWPSPFGRAAFVGTWLLRSCSKLGLGSGGRRCASPDTGEAWPRPYSTYTNINRHTQTTSTKCQYQEAASKPN